MYLIPLSQYSVFSFFSNKTHLVYLLYLPSSLFLSFYYYYSPFLSFYYYCSQSYSTYLQEASFAEWTTKEQFYLGSGLCNLRRGSQLTSPSKGLCAVLVNISIQRTVYCINIIPAKDAYGAYLDPENFSLKVGIEPRTSCTRGNCINHCATMLSRYSNDYPQGMFW